MPKSSSTKINPLKKLFRIGLNVIFSNDPNQIKQLKFGNRYQLVWISEYVGRKIALKFWENSETDFFRKNIHEGNVCLDIGANVGYYTHLFAEIVKPQGTVIAVEPLERNASLIKLNASINNTEEIIRIFQVAISDTDHQEVDFSNTMDSAFSFVVNAEGSEREGSNHIRPGQVITKVKTLTVDRIVEMTGVKQLDVVKIDVEGFEHKVLKGMSNTLSNPEMRPKLIMMELLSSHLSYYGSSIQEICGLMESYGYQPNYLDARGELKPFTIQHLDIQHNVFFTT